MNSLVEVYMVQRFGQEPPRNREPLKLFQGNRGRNMFRYTKAQLSRQLIGLGEWLQESQKSLELQGNVR
ncbi:MAG: hypothetical protein AAF702_42720 [Chloroflexota bacterium]